jgi:hypothetical protein
MDAQTFDHLWTIFLDMHKRTGRWDTTIDAFKEEYPRVAANVVDELAEKLITHLSKAAQQKKTTQPASVVVVETSEPTPTIIEPCQDEDPLEAIVEPLRSTFDLPASDRREAIRNFLSQVERPQTRRQIELGSGWMVEGQKLPKEEYAKLTDRIQGDLRKLQEEGLVKRTVKSNPKHVQGQNDKVYLYELVQLGELGEELGEDLPGGSTSGLTAEVQQLLMDALAVSTKEELLQIIAKIMVRVTGVI